MLAANRHEEILKFIHKDRFVKVSQLSRIFDVSEETIRRDLDRLEKDGLLKKLHGGAVPVDITNIKNVKPILERMSENIDEKIEIAKLGLNMIEDGDTLILDSGSTTLQLARMLSHKKITVLTNDVNIAYELAQMENINLILTGGSVRSGSFSITGSDCESSLRAYNVNKAFISASGIKLDRGLTTSNNSDAGIKKAMIKAAGTVICLTDHTKFDRTALVSFAAFDSLDIVITDRAVDRSYAEAFEVSGVQVIIP